ncbi:MAG: orotate phosphoribosyltransferase, partial [Deltaproteobacteria bacterium]|nr:orotate phosphoribosyltransferase [Deltaproteobacteria bacterium]
MTSYQDGLARFLARSGALFFAPGLKLKDGRPTPYFVNLGRINTGRTGLELAGYLSRMLVE